MTDFRGNIDHWLRQSEPDYYLFFLKGWIPFNAWYVAELPHLNKKDSKIIKELQDNPKSRPRLIIENYLKGSTHSSNKFKFHLAELHHFLEAKRLKHNGQILSFTNLILGENPLKFDKAVDKFDNVIKAEVKQGYFEVVTVDKTKRTLLHVKQPIFSLNEIEKHTDFIKINKTTQSQVLKCYRAIDPQKTVTLVSKIKSKSDSILLAGENPVHFINDPTTIAKGCITILYALRCMLFHGEIEPIPANKPIYEHSYYLLRYILKEL